MKRILTTFLLALGASALPLHAQGPGGPNSAANAALVQLFGRNTSFSAQSEIQMTPQAGSPRVPGAGGGPVTMTASTAVSQGNVRTEVDMTTMKGGQFPPQAGEEARSRWTAVMARKDTLIAALAQ